MTGTTTTLCVRRATYWDEEMGKEDPAKKGVCSNYLCDANPGMKLKLTGPSGKVREWVAHPANMSCHVELNEDMMSVACMWVSRLSCQLSLLAVAHMRSTIPPLRAPSIARL